MRKHLRRLEQLWIDRPIFFITTCTYQRQRTLDREEAASILIGEWRTARERHRWVVGRYVIMPDHVHFFCLAEQDAKSLAAFIGAWKSWTSRRINSLRRARSETAAKPQRLWQPEFFDHIIRSDESYEQKWNYLRDNPVRAGLVTTADDWPYAGEIEMLHR